MALFEKKTEGKKASGKRTVTQKPSILANRFVLRPRVTEKAYALGSANQYVFEVSKDAHKTVIARSIEEVYGVEVVDVRTVNLPTKTKVFGRRGQVGVRSAVKKAIVTVKAGQSIELFGAGV
jgi:large subunit ribosomal protein L23